MKQLKEKLYLYLNFVAFSLKKIIWQVFPTPEKKYYIKGIHNRLSSKVSLQKYILKRKDKDKLTIEEQLFLHCLSGSIRKTAFLQPLCIKHTHVLVGPHNGNLRKHNYILIFIKKFLFSTLHILMSKHVNKERDAFLTNEQFLTTHCRFSFLNIYFLKFTKMV